MIGVNVEGYIIGNFIFFVETIIYRVINALNNLLILIFLPN